MGKTRTLVEEGDQDPLHPKLAAPAGAVATNLNSHFLLYFEVSGISGLLRHASCEALSSECSHWLGQRMWKHIVNRIHLRPWNHAPRVWDRPTGPQDSWVPTSQKEALRFHYNSIMQRQVSFLSEDVFPGVIVNRTDSPLSGNKVGSVLP